MDFNDTPEEAGYRAKARAWLEQNAPRESVGGDDLEGGTKDTMAASKAWQAKKAAAGYAQITWPKEWGGAGGTPIQQVIFNSEEAKYPVPPNPFAIGLGMCVPTVMAFADDETKKRFVGPALQVVAADALARRVLLQPGARRGAVGGFFCGVVEVHQAAFLRSRWLTSRSFQTRGAPATRLSWRERR